MQGICAETEYTGRSVKAQFRYADKQNSRYVIVIGDTEVQSNNVVIKRLLDGRQDEIMINNIASYIMENK